MSRTPVEEEPASEEEWTTPSAEAPEEKSTGFVTFVEHQIEQMRAASRLGSEDISFHELNSALCNYQTVYLSLISLYNFAKIDHQSLEEDWDDWYAEKYVAVRNRENSQALAASKWLSQKELDSVVRVEYREEFRAKREVLLEAERKVAFLRRLLEAWQSQHFILSTLSRNIQAEIGSTNLESSFR